MSDLAAFLAARLDEDEAAAKAATPGSWLALDGGVQSADDEDQWPVADSGSDRNREDRVHIARHDPARVLREVAAKRAIIAWCTEVIADRDTSRFGEFGALRDDPQALAVTLAWETLRLLASVDGSHQDFDKAWDIDRPRLASG